VIQRGYRQSAKLFDARQRLLPGSADNEIDPHVPQRPPIRWKRWERPKVDEDEDFEPIDLAITDLIRAGRTPRLRDRAVLEEIGIGCPYWYAREGVVLALQAGELAALEAEDVNQQREQKRGELDELIALVPEAILNLKRIARLQPSIEAGARLRPTALHHVAMWRGDESWGQYIRAWNTYCEHVNPLAQAIMQLKKAADAARTGLTNTPPHYFDRAFAEALQITFNGLIDAAEPWGSKYAAFLNAARSSARLPEKSCERLLKTFREIDKIKSK
jgi:hypothetical protein